MPIVRKAWQGLCALLLAGIVLVPLVQVVMRDLFSAPLVGAEEFTRFLLVCLVFASYPLVVSHGENIRMGEFHDSMTGRFKRLLDGIIFLGAAFSSGFVAYATFTTIFDNLNNATPTLKIPFWVFLGSTAVGFFVACLQHLLRLRRRCRQEPLDHRPEAS